jgi:ABC-type nickel/cobalt efflux system permease component RcnA
MTASIRIVTSLALALSLAAAFLLSGGKSAEAHPLGEGAITRYLLLDVLDGEIRLRYVLDLAEIPSLEEIRRLDADGDSVISPAESAAYLERKLLEIQSSLALEVDGQPAPLRQRAGSDFIIQDGEAGLKTLRLVAHFATALPEGWQDGFMTTARDSTYKDDLGWRQVTLQPGETVLLQRSIVPGGDEIEQLTVYPPGTVPSIFTQATGFQIDSAVDDSSTGSSGDRFTRLISRERITPAFIGLAVLVAMAWGAAHALGPGHGKTIVAAYLVGSSATPWHALLLGLTVTITHTSSVIAVGLVALSATSLLPTEDLYVWLSIASGLMVVAFGGALLASRMRTALRGNSPFLPGHGHVNHAGPAHDVHGDHDHGHGHVVPPTASWRGLISLGVSGGLVPCPTALVVMLGSITLDRIVFGFVLIFAFSVGLAAVLTGVGLALLYARRVLTVRDRQFAFTRWPILQWTLRMAPVLSAAVITIVGLVLTGRALSDLS